MYSAVQPKPAIRCTILYDHTIHSQYIENAGFRAMLSVWGKDHPAALPAGHPAQKGTNGMSITVRRANGRTIIRVAIGDLVITVDLPP